MTDHPKDERLAALPLVLALTKRMEERREKERERRG